jgi:translation initiation factor 1
MKKNSKLVYSTDRGRIKPPVDPEPNSREGTDSNSQEGDNIVRIRRETSGRKGGAVTTLNGINGTDAELKALAKKLKRLCGSGGTLKNGVIEIQGDHRDKIAAALGEAGFTVKFAGG